MSNASYHSFFLAGAAPGVFFCWLHSFSFCEALCFCLVAPTIFGGQYICFLWQNQPFSLATLPFFWTSSTCGMIE